MFLHHAGRTVSQSFISPAVEEDITAFPRLLSDGPVVPPAKCFADETTSRSSDAAGCQMLPQNSERSSDNNSTGIQQPLASITCGKDTTIPVEKLGSCPDAQATLNAHNAARARWGAPPLLWAKTLADYAQTVSNTCQFAHSNGPYGENLAIGSGLSCKAALDLWMNEESQWPGPSGGFSSATGHFTQVVWKATTQVGCATRSCSGRNFITCSYNPPGNVIGQFNTQVGSLGQTPECRATTGPSLPPSSPPPPASRSPPPPPAVVVPSPPPPPPPSAGRCCYFSFCFRC